MGKKETTKSPVNDKDLQELLSSFSGYGVERWMIESYRTTLLKVQALRDAIREHKDEKGHDRCWLDDQKLPEASPGDLELPPREEFIQNCHRYWEHRQDPSATFIRQNVPCEACLN